MIANYFHQRANSGFVEGFNNKLESGENELKWITKG
jgi:hypothetical protein